MKIIQLRKEGNRIIARDGTVVVTQEEFGLRIHFHGELGAPQFGFILGTGNSTIQLVDSLVQSGQVLGTIWIGGIYRSFRGAGRYADWTGEITEWSFTPAGLQ